MPRTSEIKHYTRGQYCNLNCQLTQWSLNKMAAIFQTTFSNVFIVCVLIKISLKFACKHPIDNKWSLVQGMACCRQATSHDLNQWWPRPMTPYGVNKLEWVKQGECLSPFILSILSVMWFWQHRYHLIIKAYIIPMMPQCVAGATLEFPIMPQWVGQELATRVQDLKTISLKIHKLLNKRIKHTVLF